MNHIEESRRYSLMTEPPFSEKRSWTDSSSSWMAYLTSLAGAGCVSLYLSTLAEIGTFGVAVADGAIL